MTEDQDTKLRILQAARQEFIDKGLEGARMQEIANQAGVNKAMLHYYFRNKDTLYQQVLIELHTRFATTILQRQAANSTAEGMIRAVVETMFDAHRDQPGFVKLFVRESISDGANLKSFIPALFNLEHNKDGNIFIINEIIRLQKAGQLRNDLTPPHIALNIMGLTISSLVQHLAYPNIFKVSADIVREFLEERKEAIIKMLLDGLVTKQT